MICNHYNCSFLRVRAYAKFANMRLRFLLIFSFLCFFTGISVYSQQLTLGADNLRNVQVDRLSDQEISDYYQRAINMGLSDAQLLRMASERGMPESEINKLRKRIEKLKAAPLGSKEKADTEAGEESPDKNRISDEAGELTMTRIQRDSTVFGAEYFTEVSTAFVPNYKIATPASYILGPGDELIIQVYGYSEQTYNVTVSAEGSVYLQNVGPVQVSGLSVEAAADKIRQRLASTIYRAINSGQTRVEVTLGKIKSITVSVIGQASKPGTYTIPSLSTVFNLLYLCGGPNDNGSFREIELIRGNEIHRKIDLYEFLSKGIRSSNILLQDNDVIRIPFYQHRVTLEGEVKRQGKFEMRNGENLADLVGFSGGFSDSAYRSNMKVSRITDNAQLIRDVNSTQFENFETRPGDLVRVAKAVTRFANRITVKGAVDLPDDYEWTQGLDLRTILNSAGLMPEAYRVRGLITRINPDQSLSAIAFSPANVLAGTENVLLQPEDIVQISSIYDLKDAETVEINGEIRSPGKYPFKKDMKLKDLLLMANGTTVAADFGSIEISRRIRDAELNTDGYRQAEIINVGMPEGINDINGAIALEPFDLVIIHPKGSFEAARSVFVTGQVVNIGQYVLQNSKETISSILRRAGGFKSSADSSSVSVRRWIAQGVSEEDRQRTMEKLLRIDRDSLVNDATLRETYLRNFDFISVNIEKIKQDPGGPEDIVLEDGDLIEISRYSSLVRVSGEVFRAGLQPFEENKTALHYIQQSGNYTRSARRTGTFVIYPDGRAKSVKRFLFFKFYPDITPRSEIFVPDRGREDPKGLSPGEWIAASSIVATLATMAVTIVAALKN